MKRSRKLLAIVCCVALVLCALTCAFVVIPNTKLSNDENEQVTVQYRSAIATNDTLTIYVDYNGTEEDYEVLTPIEVSTTQSFTNTLEHIKTDYDNETGCYTYQFSIDEVPDEVYVKSPIVNVSKEIDEYAISIDFDAVQEISNAEDEVLPKSDEWFTISNITIKEEMSDKDTTWIDIQVNLNSEWSNAPRYPKLAYGDEEIGGICSIVYDDEGKPLTGEFIFPIATADIEAVTGSNAEASLVIRNEMTQVSAEEDEASDIMALDVVDENTIAQ